MFDEKFTVISAHILEKLRRGLSPALTYHSVFHSEDVLNQVVRIAGSEHITEGEELFLLKTAALYHDTGFMFTYKGHEEKSCEIAEEYLPGLGVTAPQLQRITGLIRATRIPQLPENHLEEILCDADLDYLGRDDFYSIGATLFREMKAYRIVRDEKEWNRIQADFLSSHLYFTKTSIRLRNEKKLQRLEELRQVLAAY